MVAKNLNRLTEVVLAAAVTLALGCGRTELGHGIDASATGGNLGSGGALAGSGGSAGAGDAPVAKPDDPGCKRVWSQLSPTGQAPTPRAYYAVVYDEANQRMVVFGGNTSGYVSLDDLWELVLPVDGTPEWRQLSAVGKAPPPREGASAIYDAAEGRMVLFGGKGEEPRRGPVNEVWALSLSPAHEPRWSELAVSGVVPPERAEQAAAFDPASRRMVVQGGSGGSAFGDTWMLSLAGATGPSWSSVADRSPGVRMFNTAVFAGGGRVLLFGCSRCASDDDKAVWMLTLPDAAGWSLLGTTGQSPTARGYVSAVYDGQTRVIFFGGRDAKNEFLNDTWALDWQSSGTAAWQRLAPDGKPPTPRLGHRAIYDIAGHRMVVYGGYDGSWLGDVWALSCAR